jgi:hypothetical protein
MLEMNIVLKAVLSRLEVTATAGGSLEAHRRRMITVVPGEGARAILRPRTRLPTETTAVESAAA